MGYPYVFPDAGKTREEILKGVMLRFSEEDRMRMVAMAAREGKTLVEYLNALADSYSEEPKTEEAVEEREALDERIVMSGLPFGKDPRLGAEEPRWLR